MSFADRHKKGSVFTWKVPEDKEAIFKKLSDYPVGTKLRVMAMYINSKGKYKPHPVFITDANIFIDIPAGNTEEVEKIMQTPEDIADINDGKVGIEIEAYTSKQYGARIGFHFIDMPV